MAKLNPFEKTALDYIRQYELIGAGSHILVAVSGGPDSVALVNVLVSLRDALEVSQITVIHFDHRLRGEASDADRDFVSSLAEQLCLPFHSQSEDVRSYQRRKRVSLEMAARDCRHRYFKQALHQLKAHVIALGHSSNDQAEEVLLRLIRGAGPSGLAGMLPKTRTGIIRPLLFASRRDIVRYLGDAGLYYRIDLSNDEPCCQRNVLRIELFPLIEKRFHQTVVETIARHAGLVQDDEAYWAAEVQRTWPSVCLSQSPSRIALKLTDLIDLAPALQRRIFRFSIEQIQKHLFGIYSVHTESLGNWIKKAAMGSYIHLPRGLVVIREAETLIFSKEHYPPLPASFGPCPFTITTPGEYAFSSFKLRLLTVDVRSICGLPPATPDRLWLDAEKLHWPLIIRSWNPGDRFQPLGLSGTKKLQDFFVDAHIPRSERNSVPLLCDQEKICCVLGYRLDERVKVTDSAKTVLIVEMEKGINCSQRDDPDSEINRR
jgi:tRNA(Ile)-lysidine synthase